MEISTKPLRMIEQAHKHIDRAKARKSKLLWYYRAIEQLMAALTELDTWKNDKRRVKKRLVDYTLRVLRHCSAKMVVAINDMGISNEAPNYD